MSGPSEDLVIKPGLCSDCYTRLEKEIEETKASAIEEVKSRIMEVDSGKEDVEYCE
jgi:hypothetical protein